MHSAPPIGTTSGVLRHFHGHVGGSVSHIAVNVIWRGSRAGDGQAFQIAADIDVPEGEVIAAAEASGASGNRWNENDIATVLTGMFGVPIELEAAPSVWLPSLELPPLEEVG